MGGVQKAADGTDISPSAALTELVLFKHIYPGLRPLSEVLPRALFKRGCCKTSKKVSSSPIADSRCRIGKAIFKSRGNEGKSPTG